MTLKADIDIPARMRLKIDGEKVLKKVGTRMAAHVRRRLRRGQGADGALPPPEDGENPPLRRTGELLKSVKYNSRSKTIFPTGTREGGRRRNAEVLAIQLATDQELASSDPMGVDEDLEELAAEETAREIDRQIRSGRFGLFAELRRLK